MKKDILFLGQYFYPGNNSSATLPTDTARYLSKQGYSVDALVGYHKEYIEQEVIPRKEVLDGVNIQRIRYAQLARGKRLTRLINYFSFTLSALLHVFKLRNYKSVIFYSNPPLTPLVAVLGNLLFGTKLVFVAYDVYPEVAYASNSLTPGSFIDKGMRWINRMLYRRVSAVVALTEEMKAFLLENRPELTAEKVHVIENWAHEKKRDADPAAYDVFGYTGEEFIVSYFGNLGICQDVETLLDAAERLKDDLKIRFLIVGHGTKLEYVRQQILERKLQNVQLQEFLTGKKFEQAVAVSSCCVVTLEKGLKGMCAPSKYYSYLQGGKPVLAVVEENSYLASEVQQEEVGFFVKHRDAEAFCAAIDKMRNNKNLLGTMRQNASDLYEQRYDYSVAMKKYEAMIQKVL